MVLRLARKSDLPQIKAMYRAIIEHMEQNNLSIWDEVYPCEFFQEDIKGDRLYILTEGEEIAAAFALCDSSGGAGAVAWENGREKAVYIDRLGVNVKYARRGVGSMALGMASSLAREKGAAYLRLFVVEINDPAIRLYQKNGFQRANGVYEEKIADDLILRELGFERKIK